MFAEVRSNKATSHSQPNVTSVRVARILMKELGVYRGMAEKILSRVKDHTQLNIRFW